MKNIFIITTLFATIFNSAAQMASRQDFYKLEADINQTRLKADEWLLNKDNHNLQQIVFKNEKEMLVRYTFDTKDGTLTKSTPVVGKFKMENGKWIKEFVHYQNESGRFTENSLEAPGHRVIYNPATGDYLVIGKRTLLLSDPESDILRDYQSSEFVKFSNFYDAVFLCDTLVAVAGLEFYEGDARKPVVIIIRTKSGLTTRKVFTFTNKGVLAPEIERGSNDEFVLAMNYLDSLESNTVTIKRLKYNPVAPDPVTKSRFTKIFSTDYRSGLSCSDCDAEGFGSRTFNEYHDNFLMSNGQPVLFYEFTEISDDQFQYVVPALAVFKTDGTLKWEKFMPKEFEMYQEAYMRNMTDKDGMFMLTMSSYEWESGTSLLSHKWDVSGNYHGSYKTSVSGSLLWLGAESGKVTVHTEYKDDEWTPAVFERQDVWNGKKYNY